jgi:HSP20 family protein
MLSGRALTPWQTPFSHLNSLQREMNELFSRFFGEGEQAGAAWAPLSAGYAPQIESWMQDHTFHVKADLPGMDPKDVEVTVEGTRLTLRGERKAEQEGKDNGYVHREVRYGSFVRTFTIPEGVKAEDIQATYRNGVLELSVPLPASMLPKKVNIAVESQANGQKQIGTTK